MSRAVHRVARTLLSAAFEQGGPSYAETPSDHLLRSRNIEGNNSITDLVENCFEPLYEYGSAHSCRHDLQTSLTGSETQGLWEPTSGTIIIKRSLLGSLSHFAGTLLHEVAHARTGYDDVSRELENELTQMLGTVAELHLV